MGAGDAPLRRLIGFDELPTEVFRQCSAGAAIVDVAPVIAGHVLVVSAGHAPGLCGARSETREELVEFADSLAVEMTAAYGAATIVEHGLQRWTSGERGPCIDHCHLHVLPLHGEAMLQSCGRRYDFSPVGDLGSVEFDNYLLLRSRSTGTQIAAADGRERQIWRRVACELTATFARDDWRACLYGTEAARTRDLIRRTRNVIARSTDATSDS
jgi:diadenosine tetraphosphate (Ap4A) HIT family hydrolase